MFLVLSKFIEYRGNKMKELKVGDVVENSLGIRMTVQKINIVETVWIDEAGKPHEDTFPANELKLCEFIEGRGWVVAN